MRGEMSKIPSKGVQDTKILKTRGKLGQGVGALKWGEGQEPPYELCLQKRLKLAIFQ